MGILTETDHAWWIDAEQRIKEHLVSLEGRGFVLSYRPHAEGWTDEKGIFLRRGAAEALERARDALPAGHTFEVFDGWRPWEFQQRYADRCELKIRAAHPDCPDAQVAAGVARMAPRIRIVPRLGSHRYGGAVDVTVLDAQGRALDMGVAVGHCTDDRSDLLHYHFIDAPTDAERQIRQNRTILIQAMQAGGFSPYLAEFWHWNYNADL